MEERPLNLLLVEDDEEDAMILRDELNRAAPGQFELTHVARLGDAILKARDDHFDAILLDLTLPDSSGLATFAAMRGKVPQIPVVVLTGTDDETLAVTAVHEGAQDYIVKGELSGSSLVLRIRYAVERQRTSYYRALLHERDRFYNAVSQMSDGIVVAGADWQVANANRTACLLLNLPEGAPQDRFLMEVLGGFRVSVPLDELMSSTDSVTAFEIARPQTRPPLYLDARLSRLVDEKGEFAGAVLMVRDVTDERLARNIQANFFTAVSHKLRTPLAVLWGYIQLCRVLPAEKMEAEWSHILTVCESEIQQLSDIVQKLLDFKALSTWQVPPASRQADVAAVVTSVWEDVRGRFPTREARLELRLAPEAAFVDWTAEHLGFVLEKLLDNALKFADKEPTQVVVTAQRLDEDRLSFAVADNGPGIPHEYFDRIFDGFVQVEERMTGQVPGLGLGLNMARQVIEASGGLISVSSTLGEGTEFTFTIPTRPPEAEVSAPGAEG